ALARECPATRRRVARLASPEGDVPASRATRRRGRAARAAGSTPRFPPRGGRGGSRRSALACFPIIERACNETSRPTLTPDPLPRGRVAGLGGPVIEGRHGSAGAPPSVRGAWGALRGP